MPGKEIYTCRFGCEDIPMSGLHCPYCEVVITAADQITADNAFILHVVKHSQEEINSKLPEKEKKFAIICKLCKSQDCTYFINAYDSCSEMGIKCNTCDNEESDWT